MNVTKIYVYLWLLFTLFSSAALNVTADVIYYTLDNVVLDDSTGMTGIFSWTYDVEDFANGTGQFLSLAIPHTSHDESDLATSFDIGKSIELTLDANVDGDGVDITLVLDQPLTPTGSSLLNLTESRYEIGGNGFHTGAFQNGSVSRVNIIMDIETTTPGFASISWEPDITGFVLQETQTLSPTNWINSASGSNNPAFVFTTAPRKFYRVSKP